VVDTRVCTSAGEIPDAVITQGECEKLDPDGLAYYSVRGRTAGETRSATAVCGNAKKDATASTTAAELPTNPPTSVVSDATGLSPNTHPPHDALGNGGVADVGGVVGHQTRDIDYTRLTGGPISTEVLEAAGGVSDADSARYMYVHS
jgi:hypothetical protein